MIGRAGNGVKALMAFMLLPLSLIPIYLVVGKLRSDYDSFSTKYLQRDTLAAPAVDPPPYSVAHWAPLPAYTDMVPVLVYHGINQSGDYYSVDRRGFAEQMEMLERADFTPIGIAQYVSFLQGDETHMPERPILITFDDSRLDSYRGADKVLAEHGFRATMFTIVGHVDEKNPFFTDWRELRRMASSGRWDVQEGSGVGHLNVDYDAHGHQGPFYAYRRWTPEHGLESFAAYKRRVTQDIEWGKRLLSEQIPGYTPWAFAVPFGNYGQFKSNDPRIPGFMQRLLRRNFQATFLTAPADYTTPATSPARIGRYEVHQRTTADGLYDWLRARYRARQLERDRSQRKHERRVKHDLKTKKKQRLRANQGGT